MVNIVKDEFKLRSFTNTDSADLVTHMNKEIIARDTTINQPWNIDQASWWISFINDAEHQKPLSEIHFAIEIDGKLAGSVAIINIIEHKAEIGYWIAEQHTNRGIMSQAIDEVTKYSFNNLKLHRIFAPVLTHNQASARVLEKTGFKLEGTLTKYFKKNGKYVDALCYAKTAGP